jgi:glutathione S-transferase
MIRAGNMEAARAATVALLERIRADVAAGRGGFVEMTERTSPASLHDRRAGRRIEIALAEVDAALKHLRRALKDG